MTQLVRASIPKKITFTYRAHAAARRHQSEPRAAHPARHELGHQRCRGGRRPARDRSRCAPTAASPRRRSGSSCRTAATAWTTRREPADLRPVLLDQRPRARARARRRTGNRAQRRWRAHRHQRARRGVDLRAPLPGGIRDCHRRGPAPPDRDDRRSKEVGNVLVVDDEPMVRTMARDLLESAGFTVVEAATGTRGGRALPSAPGTTIDVVILDMTMPGMSGAEALREIRALDAEARVILTSGYDAQDTVAALRDLDGVAFLQKALSRPDVARKDHGGAGEPRTYGSRVSRERMIVSATC